MILLHKGRGEGLEIVLLSYDRNGGSYKTMNGAGKGKSCRDEGGLFLLLIFAEKTSEEHGYDLGRMWIRKPLRCGRT